MRRGVQEVGSLVKSLEDELQLPEVALCDSLFQVSHAAVHKLGGSAASASGKVLGLHQRGSQTTRSGIQRSSSASSATCARSAVERRRARCRHTANYENVKASATQLSHLLRPRLWSGSWSLPRLRFALGDRPTSTDDGGSSRRRRQASCK